MEFVPVYKPTHICEVWTQGFSIKAWLGYTKQSSKDKEEESKGILKKLSIKYAFQ